MLNTSSEVQRKHVLEDAKAWWEKLTENEKTLQMNKGKLIDSHASRSIWRSRLMGWDQVDLEQYRHRILGNHK
jgi:hypothetical protein